MSSWPMVTLNSESLCPQKDNISCTDDHSHQWNLFLGPIPTYVSLISCSLSCLGAVSIILTHLLFKELRSGSRSIITFLSIADLLTALGYIAGGINYLVHYRRTDTVSCNRFETVCIIQSYVTTWSQLSSYVWNCTLAVYLFLTIAFAKNRLANKIIPFAQVIAWGLPIVVTLPLLLFDFLGYSPYSASNWCFIKDIQYEKKKWLTERVIVPIVLARILPELITYLVIIVLYTTIKYFIFRMKRKLKEEKRTSVLEDSLKRIDNKLLMIPMAFVLLRIWGFVQFFFALTVSNYFETGCVSYPIHIVYYILGILEAIGDGGQGWTNALLFIVFNAKIRHLIFAGAAGLLFKCCSLISRKHHDSLLEKLAGHSTTSRGQESDESTIEDTLNTNSTGLHEVGGESFHANKIIQQADY